MESLSAKATKFYAGRSGSESELTKCLTVGTFHAFEELHSCELTPGYFSSLDQGSWFLSVPGSQVCVSVLWTELVEERSIILSQDYDKHRSS